MSPRILRFIKPQQASAVTPELNQESGLVYVGLLVEAKAAAEIVEAHVAPIVDRKRVSQRHILRIREENIRPFASSGILGVDLLTYLSERIVQSSSVDWDKTPELYLATVQEFRYQLHLSNTI